MQNKRRYEIKKKYVVMLIDALMSIEKIESFIVSVTEGYGIRGKKFAKFANVYEVLWKASKFKKLTDDESQEAYYTTCNSIIASLQIELSNPEIDSDERARIEDKMIGVAGMIGEKDSENKKFILKVLAVCGAMAGSASVAAVTLLGGNTDIQSIDRDKDDDDIIDGE